MSAKNDDLKDTNEASSSVQPPEESESTGSPGGAKHEDPQGLDEVDPSFEAQCKDKAEKKEDASTTEVIEDEIREYIPTFDPDLKESDLNLPKECFLLSKQNDGLQIPYYFTSEEELSRIRPPEVVKTWEQRFNELDEKQKETFEAFVVKVKEAPWYEEKFDNWYCLRYLIARSYDITKAFQMLEKTAKWLKETNYDEKGACEICSKDPNQHCGQFMGWDREHRPVMCMSMRWGPERKKPLEHMVCCFKHMISMMPVGVEKWVCVTDFESYSHFKDGKPSMGLSVINTIQDHFPERLGKMICVNPPTLFWALYKAFYPFIDPVTRTKVEFVYTEDKPSAYDIFPKLFPYHLRAYLYDIYHRSKHKLPAVPLVWTPNPEGYPNNYKERTEEIKRNKEKEHNDKKKQKEEKANESKSESKKKSESKDSKKSSKDDKKHKKNAEQPEEAEASSNVESQS